MRKYRSTKQLGKPRSARSPALQSVLARVSSLADLGERIKTSKQAVARWDDVPLERLMEVSEAVGLPPSQIRPDYVPQLLALEKRMTSAA